MVNAGKMIWKVTTKANWIRDKRTGSRSIGHLRAVNAVQTLPLRRAFPATGR
jgi:hypothetical protein